ncbi:hypothetical protein C0585_07455 [Candidatus Woesearchaeota archaeon]|nr:MAG: hypothetical protein C0585_07455 [Candidatus Woesearchaeota archaeon]
MKEKPNLYHMPDKRKNHISKEDSFMANAGYKTLNDLIDGIIDHDPIKTNYSSEQSPNNIHGALYEMLDKYTSREGLTNDDVSSIINKLSNQDEKEIATGLASKLYDGVNITLQEEPEQTKFYSGLKTGVKKAVAAGLAAAVIATATLGMYGSNSNAIASEPQAKATTIEHKIDVSYEKGVSKPKSLKEDKQSDYEAVVDAWAKDSSKGRHVSSKVDPKTMEPFTEKDQTYSVPERGIGTLYFQKGKDEKIDGINVGISDGLYKKGTEFKINYDSNNDKKINDLDKPISFSSDDFKKRKGEFYIDLSKYENAKTFDWEKGNFEVAVKFNDNILASVYGGAGKLEAKPKPIVKPAPKPEKKPAVPAKKAEPVISSNIADETAKDLGGQLASMIPSEFEVDQINDGVKPLLYNVNIDGPNIIGLLDERGEIKSTFDFFNDALYLNEGNVTSYNSAGFNDFLIKELGLNSQEALVLEAYYSGKSQDWLKSNPSSLDALIPILIQQPKKFKLGDKIIGFNIKR